MPIVLVFLALHILGWISTIGSVGGPSMAGESSKKNTLRLVHEILLIEDDAALRRSLSRAFRKRGLEVVAVGDLDAALRVSLADIDAILADVCVGARLVHEIVPQLIAAEPLVPIVAFTGLATFEHGFTLRDMGVRWCVTKPADPGELVDLLERAARELAGGTAERFADFRRLRPRALRRLIRDALAQTDGRVTAAARSLGYSRSALQYWMRHTDIEPHSI